MGSGVIYIIPLRMTRRSELMLVSAGAAWVAFIVWRSFPTHLVIGEQYRPDGR